MQTARQIPAGMTDDEVMMTADATCRFFGGSERPIHIATLYRGIAAGRYPPPVMIGPNSARWLLSECRTARQKAIDARAGTPDPGEEPSKPRGRGARKRQDQQLAPNRVERARREAERAQEMLAVMERSAAKRKAATGEEAA